MKPRKSILPYLILNVFVSAITTLLVLFIWNQFHKPAQISSPITPQNITVTMQATVPACPESLSVLPDPSQPVIEISNVFGAGDLKNEVVELVRIGEGDVCLTGWQIHDKQNHTFTFPNLVLNKDGKISLYTRAGTNQIDSLFWGLDAPVWSIGDTVTLIDPNGEVRATFIIQ